MTFGPSAVAIETGVQDAGERRTFLGHAFDGGAHDFLDGLVDHGLRNLRHRAVGTHATGVRTLVAIVGALVILGDGHRPEIGAVDKAHQGEFPAVQEVLDNDLGTGGAEAMVDEDVFECALAACSSMATVTPLPAARPSALMTIGAPCSCT